MQDERLPQGVGKPQRIGMRIERPAVAGPDPGGKPGRRLAEPGPGKARFEDRRVAALTARRAIEQDAANRLRVAAGKVEPAQGLGVLVQEFRMRREDAEDEGFSRRRRRPAEEQRALRQKRAGAQRRRPAGLVALAGARPLAAVAGPVAAAEIAAERAPLGLADRRQPRVDVVAVVAPQGLVSDPAERLAQALLEGGAALRGVERARLGLTRPEQVDER